MFGGRKFNLEQFLLFLVLLLSFFLRFWRLSDFPALNADEAAIGYNAYSLIQTGKDEHGNTWPIHFQSFNDYKPGFYFYLVLPLVKFLGLTELAVRIPSAILGVATVYLIYLLPKLLFPKTKSVSLKLICFLSGFLLAISPWHIHFSRGGWEVNVSTFLTLLGVCLFLMGVKRANFWNLLISFLAFALSLYTYHSARVLTPFLMFGLSCIFFDRVKKIAKKFSIVLLFFLVFIFPLTLDLRKPEVFSRAAGVGLFADPGPVSRINEQRGEHTDFQSFLPRLLHNKLVNYSLAFLNNYSKHFNFEFLFLSGDDIQRNKVPETGEMYIFDFILIFWGFVSLFVGKLNEGRERWFLLYWLLISPLASALTFQSPNALRSENMVIPLTVISAIGLSDLSNRLKEKRLNIVILAIFLIISWQFLRYQHMYWVHMAKEYPYSSQYGVKELVHFIKEEEKKFDKIIVTTRYDQPYILFLFYLKYPPAQFQVSHRLTAKDRFGFSTVASFDKFEFRKINWDVDKPENPNSLIVGTDEEIPNEANIIKEIFGTNGFKYFQIVAN